MTEAEFRARLKAFEGYAGHMYLHMAGEVTIGAGLMLPSADAAQSASLGFHERESQVRADAEAIWQDFARFGEASAGMYPTDEHRPYTDLVAATEPLEQALDRRLETAESDALAFYPQYRQLPSTVQYALLDMAFNLGRAGCCSTPGSKPRYRTAYGHVRPGNCTATAFKPPVTKLLRSGSDEPRDRA